MSRCRLGHGTPVPETPVLFDRWRGFPLTHSEVYHIHTSLCNLIHGSVGIYNTHSAVYIYKVTKSLIYKNNKNLIF
nr:MAG TPA: hypothetical protein [Caudoviricetes sp.]